MVYYFDASALTKMFAPEAGAGMIAAMLAGLGDDQAVSARLGLVEVVSAIARLARQGDLPLAEAEAAIAALQDPQQLITEVLELTPSVAAVAIDCLQRHRLRASDAIHLATALKAGADVFVCADNRLLQAALAEGLHCINPTAPAPPGR